MPACYGGLCEAPAEWKEKVPLLWSKVKDNFGVADYSEANGELSLAFFIVNLLYFYCALICISFTANICKYDIQYQCL